MLGTKIAAKKDLYIIDKNRRNTLPGGTSGQRQPTPLAAAALIFERERRDAEIFKNKIREISTIMRSLAVWTFYCRITHKTFRRLPLGQEAD